MLAEATLELPELSPSETILLTGERYTTASSIWTVNVQLIHSAEKVQAVDLCRTILIAALLDGESQGVFSLEVRRETHKRLFGLLGSAEHTVLYVVPKLAHHYPLACLEARLANQIANGAAKLEDVIYTILLEDSAEPWLQVFNFVLLGLNQRHLLVGEKVQHLLWTSTDIKASDTALEAVRGDESRRIDALLSSTRGQRAELWECLNRSLAIAHSARLRKDEPDERYQSNND